MHGFPLFTSCFTFQVIIQILNTLMSEFPIFALFLISLSVSLSNLSPQIYLPTHLMCFRCPSPLLSRLYHFTPRSYLFFEKKTQHKDFSSQA